MKATEFWLWVVPNELTGKPHKTRYRMTEAVALARFPTAQKVPGSCEVRDLPETPEELGRAHTHSINLHRPRE